MSIYMIQPAYYDAKLLIMLHITFERALNVHFAMRQEVASFWKMLTNPFVISFEFWTHGDEWDIIFGSRFSSINLGVLGLVPKSPLYG